jgi:sugar phosphate isomerase/epimerase
MELLKRAIECCSYLKIDNIVVHSIHQKGFLKEECFKENKAFYLSFLDFANDLGVKILTENFNKMIFPSEWYWIDNPHDLIELIESVDHPNLGVCYDIGHANLIDIPQHEQIKLLGKYINAIHVQDNNGEKDYHVPPLMGTTNFDSVMYGLKEIGFKGYFTLEAEYTFMRSAFKTKFEKDDRLGVVPLFLKLESQKMLYKIAKHILESYDLFEE